MPGDCCLVDCGMMMSPWQGRACGSHAAHGMMPSAWVGACAGMAGRDSSSSSTTLLTLCSPPGVGKQLPYTVSAAGNTLFEEPCVCYLPLVICKVGSLEF